ncbi:IS66 family transposase [Alkalimarinus alittae]|uniref:IS66 family transposase n=1 Tax=Alkalimarinus alittae TaxID=2961619 RepID=A0ABY6N531_9ALTE|nr:IS66 family transposase [Alkalimarinus alittae]UZE97201.1 IS66 family transposase [Alkalimarinus alittae]
MKINPNNLPNDVESLKALVQKQQNLLDEKQAEVDKKQARVEQLEEQWRLFLHRKFASQSEKAPGQGELFNETEETAEDPILELDAEAILSPETKTKAKTRGRKPLPSELPRVKVIHDLPESERQCPCGCQLSEIGEETSEQLDIIPAKIRVLQHIQKKYACKACEDKVKTAFKPAQPIPKSNASAGLLAHIAVSKYQDALPLYRQEGMFKRVGIHLPRQTLANWVIRSSELLQPLINLMRDQLLASPVIHCDETVVKVLKEPDKPASSQSYMWVQVAGPPQQRIILFDYDQSRSGQVPLRLLSGYQGYLQTDGYEGYNAVASQPGVTQLCCMAHARRKFMEAKKAQPKAKAKTRSKVDVAIDMIGKLYGLERAYQDATPENRYQMRQEKAKPVLEKLRHWLDKTLPAVPPTTLLGKALNYLHKYWSRLTTYLEDGRLNIDNNIAENAIRPFVIGRKNWLFSDTPRGAHASARIYSVIETAKANGLEPYAYLKQLFTELPRVSSVDDVEALLPWNQNLTTLLMNETLPQGGV